MAAITFDTLKFANRLKSPGVPPAHAEAEAEALSEVLELAVGDLVTNEYLDFRLSQLEERMTASMTQLEQRMTIRLGVLMAASVGIVAALVERI